MVPVDRKERGGFEWQQAAAIGPNGINTGVIRVQYQWPRSHFGPSGICTIQHFTHTAPSVSITTPIASALKNYYHRYY
jgi:hypothetical protein